MAGASVESCQYVVLRSPWGRLGSVLYTCKRLHRMRRRFKHFWPISLSRPLRLGIFRACLASSSKSITLAPSLALPGRYSCTNGLGDRLW